MAIRTVTDAIRYVGVDDNTLALFENQYPVQPMGVSYNSYVILDGVLVFKECQCVIIHPYIVDGTCYRSNSHIKNTSYFPYSDSD